MFGIGRATRIYLAPGATDMRKGFEGLHGLVRDHLGCDPESGHVFVFTNVRRNRVKLLVYDGSGLWVCAKRLEKGRFVWPPIVDGAMTLTPAQFSVLVEAMDWRGTIAPPLPAQPMLV